jgi:hypothetical protein
MQSATPMKPARRISGLRGRARRGVCLSPPPAAMRDLTPQGVNRAAMKLPFWL